MIISQSFLIYKLEIMTHRVVVRTTCEECQVGNEHKETFFIIVVVDTIAIVVISFYYFPYVSHMLCFIVFITILL